MGSRHPLAPPPLLDGTDFPRVLVDGLESHTLRDGLAISRFYMIEPLASREVNLSPFRPLVRRICLEMVAAETTELAIRRQLATLHAEIRAESRLS